MYNAGITADELIKTVESEADVSFAIPRETWIRAINTVEQFLYMEILKEYIAVRIPYADVVDNSIELSSVPVNEGAAVPNYDDVIRVFADENEVERSGAVGAVEFPEKQLYYTRYGGDLTLALEDYPDEIVLIVRLRPKLKDNDGADLVAVPPEFVYMVAAKMRGEAYKIANEDALAAKWLSDYNAQLENFKVWAMARNARYGG